MKDFFIKLLTAGSGLSSKRFTSLWAMVLLTVIVIAILFAVVVPDIIIWALVSIVLGQAAMTLVQNNNKTE